MKAIALEIREIPGRHGYKVSIDGTVWSCVGRGSKPRLTESWHRIATHKAQSGHLAVRLGRKFRTGVHRLVALAFIGPCPDGCEVRHLDGNPENNHVGNLQYGTRSENCKDKVRHGRFNASDMIRIGSMHPRAKLTELDVREIKRLLRCGLELKEIASRFHVHFTNISCIKRGITWKHVS